MSSKAGKQPAGPPSARALFTARRVVTLIREHGLLSKEELCSAGSTAGASGDGVSGSGGTGQGAASSSSNTAGAGSNTSSKAAQLLLWVVSPSGADDAVCGCGGGCMAARQRLAWPDSVPLVNPNSVSLNKGPSLAIVEWAQGKVADGGKGLDAATEQVQPFIAELSKEMGACAAAGEQQTAQQSEQQVRWVDGCPAQTHLRCM